MIKGAIFDMDGLMFDTETLVYRAWQKVMDKNGFDYNFEIYKKTVGRRTVEVKKLYEELYGNSFDYHQMRRQANVYFREDVEKNGLPVKKGLYNILNFLKENSIKVAMATSTSSPTAMELVEKAGVGEYFEKFICGNMVKNGKPHPEVFLTATKEIGVLPKDCIALEDSINGIKSAYSAGTKPIMVPDMLEPTEEIKPMLFALCKDLDEAIQYFKQ